jgi:hypothetical protein
MDIAEEGALVPDESDCPQWQDKMNRNIQSGVSFANNFTLDRLLVPGSLLAFRLFAMVLAVLLPIYLHYISHS